MSDAPRRPFLLPVPGSSRTSPLLQVSTSFGGSGPGDASLVREEGGAVDAFSASGLQPSRTSPLLRKPRDRGQAKRRGLLRRVCPLRLPNHAAATPIPHVP
ncbi:hypothetical protein CVE28_26900 [Pseudomonas syringae pv. actinidiae]|nr:hypothetical protein [Pseudomonas syringae pv. actinidiae]NAS94431.1 hypothetical protein [Pseudomonas syringae pv. actinidiae]